MAVFAGFVGQAYAADSLLADAQSSVNWFVEGIQSGQGQNSAGYLRETPGITLAITLPTSPMRGIWANASSMYAVAGTDLYQLFSQIGTCTTNGTAVTWSAGAQFDNTNGVAGNTIWINGVQYTVASYASATELTLTASAGVQASAVAYSAMTYIDRSVLFSAALADDGMPVQFFANGNQLLIASANLAYCDGGAGPVEVGIGSALTGTIMITAVGGHPSTVHWISGDLFTLNLAGQAITINGTGYTVGSVANTTTLVLTTGPGGTLAPVAFSVTPPLAAFKATFLDGYFVVSQPGLAQFNFSAINDGTSWDPLDYATKAGYPDAIAAPFADHEELWLFGTDTTEVWQDVGAALQPFQRISGAFIHHGLLAPFSPVRLLNGVACLSSDPVRGGVTAYLYQGFIPQRISTHAIETAWARYATCADAVSFYYSEQGHEFWVITFPSGNATWVYDGTEGAWHQRAWFNARTDLVIGTPNTTVTSAGIPFTAGDAGATLSITSGTGFTVQVATILSVSAGGVATCSAALGTIGSTGGHGGTNDRQRQMFHAFVFGQHYVGDWANGNVYIQSQGTYTDNGVEILRQRAAPHLNTEHLWSFFNEFELLVDTYGQSVTFTLDWSDDGAQTWHAGITAVPNGVSGQALRTIWRRLGRSRDRIFRVTVSAADKVAIVNAYLDVST